MDGGNQPDYPTGQDPDDNNEDDMFIIGNDPEDNEEFLIPDDYGPSPHNDVAARRSSELRGGTVPK